MVGGISNPTCFQQGGRAPVHLHVVHQPVALRQVFEQQVLRHRQVREQVQLLVHDADAGAVRIRRRARTVRPAVERDVSLVGDVDAGEQIDQRRLARAVLAEQHVRLAARDVERHVLQRHDPGEMLTDASQLEKRADHRVGNLQFGC